MATKVRNGKVLPELRNMPEIYSIKKTVPVECRPYPNYPLSNVRDPVSMGLTRAPVFPVCTLRGNYLTNFSNHTLKVDLGDRMWGLSYGSGYDISFRSIGSKGRQLTFSSVNGFEYLDLTITPNGKHFVFMNETHYPSYPITVPTSAWKNLNDPYGNLIAKITK